MSGDKLRLTTDSGRQLDVWSPVEHIVSDDEFPLHIFSFGMCSFVAEAGVITRSAERLHDGSDRTSWHPFQRSEDVRGTEWAGRVSYGAIRLRAYINSESVPLVFEVVPSGLSKRQIEAMRSTIATLASELIFERRGGTTKTTVGLRSELPPAWGPVQDQLHRFLEEECHAARLLSSIAKRPLANLAPPKRPQRRGCPRAIAGAPAPEIDILENRVVGAMVRSWAWLLHACARIARDEADRAERKLLEEPPAGAARPSPDFLESRRVEIAAVRAQGAKAALLAFQLRSAAGTLVRLPSVPGMAIRETPRSARDARYAALLRAWWNIRRECVLQTPNRTATRKDVLASFLYEQWVLFVLVGCLRRLGWTAADDGWLDHSGMGRYEVRVRRGVPWTFTHDGETITLWYEPMLHQGRPEPKQGGKKAKAQSVLERAMRNVYFKRPSILTFYSAKGTFTPDYLLTYRSKAGEYSLVLGDAIYVQVRDDDGPSSALPECQRRFAALRTKAEKVHEKYARETFMAVPNEGVVRAIDDLAFVVFPGPPDATEWMPKVYEGVVPLALRPGDPDLDGPDAIANLEAAVEAVRILVDGARENAIIPQTFELLPP